MHRRCYQPSQRNYKDYGAKGITVEASWHDFASFLRDMGEQPEGMTLDRKINTLGYSWLNCEWASRLEQARNKRTTRWLQFNGENLCLTEWAERLGIKPKTLRARIDDHGWTVERALSTTKVMNRQETMANARKSRRP